MRRALPVLLLAFASGCATYLDDAMARPPIYEARGEPRYAPAQAQQVLKGIFQDTKHFDTELYEHRIGPVSIRFLPKKLDPNHPWIKAMGGDSRREIMDQYEALPPASCQVRTAEERFLTGDPHHRIAALFPREEEARKFADAIYAMKAFAATCSKPEPAESWKAFEAQLPVWKGKKDLPEEARRHFAVAQSAMDEKRLEDAVFAFEEGLALAPWYADGHFNAALVCGELECWGLAVRHMRRHLALMSEGPEARAARDKLYVWEEKLK